ncbi:hypothetical protein C8A01DRAFT_37434 [Parachaetomium inaequale]|uniref:Uncharacterized protein n=1 Tax=Parachaetomium inaequale TaxID=2588326 RepID=A0AAN6PCY7_9PEZI|nr:hypothetical protein C8A01DRAFT_37434 [Parachaetomium inaequale]
MRNHILLPALQFAAAAFFAKAALAAPTADNTDTNTNTQTYCVDGNHRVVATSNCDDVAVGGGKLMTVQGPPGLEIGDLHVPAGSQARNVAREQQQGDDDDDMVSGGFGEVEQRDEATSTTSSRGSRPTGS